MAEKAKKTTVEPVGMDAARVNGTYGPTQETTATVATQATGDEPGTTTPNRGLSYEPTSTPVKNEGVSEQSAHARMQGVNNAQPVNTVGTVAGNGAVKNATNTTANTPAATVAPVTGTPAANTAGTVVTGQPSGTGQPKTEVETSGTVAKGVPTNGTGYTVTAADLDEDKELKQAIKDFSKLQGEGGTSEQIKKDYAENPNAVRDKMGVAGTDPEAVENLRKENASKDSKEKYGADWTKGFTKQALRDSKLGIAEAMQSYNQYCETHPEAPKLNMFNYFAYQQYDPNKSLAENEAEEKKTKKREQWEDIQNALFSFADLYHGVKWAPAPQNAETTEQLTKRQQERRDRVKVMRDKDWQTLQAMWKQQSADEIAKANAAAKASAQAKTDAYRAAKLKIEQDKAKNGNQAAQDKHEQVQSKINNDNKKTDAQVNAITMNAESNRIRANKTGSGRGGRGSTKYNEQTTKREGYDNGKKVTYTEKKYTPVGSGGSKGNVARKSNGKKKIG